MPQYIDLPDGAGRLVIPGGRNLSGVRRARPYQVRNCYQLKPDEAKQVGNRCYICEHIADLYIEAGEAPDTGKEIVWRYTMFLCSWCVKIHDVDVTRVGGEPRMADVEATPPMFAGHPLWGP